MSLLNWNTHRYNTKHTSYLIHLDYYDDMQHFLNETLEIVNNEIFAINEENLVMTPHLAGHITTKRGEGEGHRVRYSRLWDGCHPVDPVIENWEKSLYRIMAINRHRYRLL